MDPGSPTAVSVIDFVEERLRARREAISREINEVPPPIPACDANVNRLLEDRAHVVDELQRLARLRGQAASGDRLRRFVETATGLDDAARASALALLERITVAAGPPR